MTKSEAVAKAGSQAALAALLHISRQAVSRWPETIPPLRLYQLREQRPRWFRKSSPAAS